MPPYVRKQPLSERLRAFLSPQDFLLWLSEELETNGWDQLEKEYAVPIGVACNLIFLVARSNSKRVTKTYDDVFGESPGISATSWLVRPHDRLHRLVDFADMHPGCLHRSLLNVTLWIECDLHILQEEELSSIRNIN